MNQREADPLWSLNADSTSDGEVVDVERFTGLGDFASAVLRPLNRQWEKGRKSGS